MDSGELMTLRDILSRSKRIVFFGGAGVSTASGIPDFRSASGLFSEKFGNLSPEMILSKSFFYLHPDIFFQFWRKHMLYPDAKPNAAHLFLYELEKRDKPRLTPRHQSREKSEKLILNFISEHPGCSAAEIKKRQDQRNGRMLYVKNAKIELEMKVWRGGKKMSYRKNITDDVRKLLGKEYRDVCITPDMAATLAERIDNKKVVVFLVDNKLYVEKNRV